MSSRTPWSPLFGDLTGLPELFMFASNHEILLADSTRLHEKALKQGVKSTLIQRDKLPHVWPTMLMLPEARRDLKISGEFVTRVARRAVAKAD
jgi:monoterpene epsilon-lactone hydrolase